MVSALKTIGIKSYVALINAQYNQEPVDREFPCNRFNHAILCVPLVKDSIWLECTSNTADFAILGSFTENRNALLLTENGGVLVATPSSKSSNNTLFSTTSITLEEDGSGRTNTSLCSKGEFKEFMNEVVTAKKDDQKMMIVKMLGFKQPDDFLVIKKSQAEELNVDIELTIEKIPQFNAGSKMFLNPRVYSLWRLILPKSDGRLQDYYFRSPFIRTDTTIYNLPENYIPEAIPLPDKFNCDYATYATNYSYVKEKNQLLSIARLELNQNRIPAAKYGDIKKFFDKVLTDDTRKIVIKKN
jgi:hypothetical protein